MSRDGEGASPSYDYTELIIAARKGSNEALGRLLNLFRMMLIRLANEQLDPDLRVKEGASDIVQESLLEAQRDFESFRGSRETDLACWLRKILHNNLADLIRRYRRTEMRDVNREIRFDNLLHDGRQPELMAQGASPSDIALKHERLELLRSVLTRLPRVYQDVIELRNRDRLSWAEIGERLGRTDEAARKLWFRAIEELKELMDTPHA